MQNTLASVCQLDCALFCTNPITLNYVIMKSYGSFTLLVLQNLLVICWPSDSWTVPFLISLGPSIKYFHLPSCIFLCQSTKNKQTSSLPLLFSLDVRFTQTVNPLILVELKQSYAKQYIMFTQKVLFQFYDWKLFKIQIQNISKSLS